MMRINPLQDKTGQAILEYALLLIVAVLAFVAIHGLVNRALQGRTRSSADSIASRQFSAGHTNWSRTDIFDVTVEEEFLSNATTIRMTQQTFQTIEHQTIDPFTAEYEEM